MRRSAPTVCSAFAIWDRHERVLFAARDRMGVKPFYYRMDQKGFAFASRPRALAALYPDDRSKTDEQALRWYLEAGYVPAPASIHQVIRKLPARTPSDPESGAP